MVDERSASGGKRRRKAQPKAARKAKTDESDEEELEQHEQNTDQGGALRKALGDSDKMVRDKALKLVSQQLKRGHDIDEPALRKLWKALFYTMWHADKHAVQAELAQRLAALVNALPVHKRHLFNKVFWDTMVREWHGIDRLRLDKFYLLSKHALEESLADVRSRGWREDEVLAFSELLRTGPLARRAPMGVRYYLVDNFCTVLRTLNIGKHASSSEGATQVLMALIDPLVSMLGDAEAATLLSRLSSRAIEPLFVRTSSDESGDETADSDGQDATEQAGEPLPQCAQQLADRLFEIASSKETRERNRQFIYELQKRVEDSIESVEPQQVAPPSKRRTKASAERLDASDVNGDGGRDREDSQLNALREIIRKSGDKRRRDDAANAANATDSANAIDAEPNAAPATKGRRQKKAAAVETAAAAAKGGGRKVVKGGGRKVVKEAASMNGNEEQNVQKAAPTNGSAVKKATKRKGTKERK